MIRLLLAEDQALVRGALKALLEIEDDIRVVAEAANGRDAIALAASAQAEVCLLDVEMPEMNGLEATSHIAALVPAPRVIILTTFARPGYLASALHAGAMGYLLKSSPAGELAAAIRRVHAGGRAIDPDLAVEALRSPNPLSEREREVLAQSERRTTAEIGAALGLSEGTVRNYLSSAISKLGAGARQEAAHIARRAGWLPPEG